MTKVAKVLHHRVLCGTKELESYNKVLIDTCQNVHGPPVRGSRNNGALAPIFWCTRLYACRSAPCGRAPVTIPIEHTVNILREELE